MCHLNMSTLICVSGLESCKAEYGGEKEEAFGIFSNDETI